MAPDLSRLKVVIVDDMSFMCDILRALLDALNVTRVRVAGGCGEGWAEILDFNPDVVICDWQMTDGAGIELLKMIRRSPNSPNPFLPVMMVTAFSEEQRVYSALREGATCYLKKPISAASFYQKFMFCLEDRREFEQTENYFGPELGALDFEDVVFDDA